MHNVDLKMILSEINSVIDGEFKFEVQQLVKFSF
jgi:hypothetical protein